VRFARSAADSTTHPSPLEHYPLRLSKGYVLDALSPLHDLGVGGGGRPGETDHRHHHIRRRERNREREHPYPPPSPRTVMLGLLATREIAELRFFVTLRLSVCDLRRFSAP